MQLKLTNEELKKYYYGAYSFSDAENGYLQAFQYTEEQMKYFEGAFDFWYDRSMATTAKTIEFISTAGKISFDYSIIWVGSEDSFEVAVDGLIHQIVYVKDIEREGRIQFDLPEGRKEVTVYLPADATVLVKNFESDAELEPVVKKTKVLWLGDSITQGYGPLRSACTYVSVANRILNYDIINQGIGGYVYDKNSLMKMDGYMPEKIIVSLGTNQYGAETMKDVEEFYERLIELYGNTIPILCITPIWRGDNMEGVPTLEKFCSNIKKICEQYSNISIVDGFTLVPHLSEYFLDNLHPNALGAEIYGRNLVNEMDKFTDWRRG